MIIVDQPDTARMGSCCSHDDNEAAASAAEEQANKVAAVSQRPTPLHKPAAAKDATESAAKIGLSQTTAAEAAAASHPPDDPVVDTGSIAKPLADVLPSFWSRQGSWDGDMIEGEVVIYARPSGSSRGK